MQSREDLIREVKEFIVSTLALEDVSADDIDADAPLFGEGLNLDSIDALELALAVTKKYGIKLDEGNDEVREHFRSVSTLAALIESRSKPAPGVS